MADQTIFNSDFHILRLLRLGPFERRQIRGRDRGWRFGTRRIADSVVDRLVAAGRAEIADNQVRIRQ